MDSCNIYIALIYCDAIAPSLDLIEVSEDFLNVDLGEAMIDEGNVDSDQEWDELPEEEKINYFLFDYCGYDPGNCHWHVCDSKPEINRLTPESFR